MMEKPRESHEEKPRGIGDAAAQTQGADGGSRGGWRTWVLVLGVFVIPLACYAAIPAVAMFPVPSGRKVVFSAALVVVAEGTFLVSALVLGREAVRRYRRYLSPRYWFGRSGKG